MNLITSTKSKKTKKRRRNSSGKTDYFCREKITEINYRDLKTVRRFINAQGRIVSQLHSRLLRKNHNRVSLAIRRARQMALLPYEISLQKILIREPTEPRKEHIETEEEKEPTMRRPSNPSEN